MKRSGSGAALPAGGAMKRVRMPALPPAMERELPPQCHECGSDDIVEDWAQGNAVCRGCGLVVQERLLDLSSEWRTFASEEGDDPNRVGGPANPLLESGLGTDIGAAPKGAGGRGMMGLKNTQHKNAVSAADKVMLDVMSKIDRWCDRLSLQRSVGNRAKELFKRYQDYLTLEDDGKTRKRTLRNEEIRVIMAGALFIACRNEKGARSYKEICGLTVVSKRDIGQIVKKIEAVLPDAKTAHQRDTEDFVTRFCNSLNLPRTTMRTADQVALAAREQEGVYGKTYVTIAAASIFLVCQLSDVSSRKTEKEISAVTGVAEVTIRSTYRLILPHIASVVPADFVPVRPFRDLLAAAGISAASAVEAAPVAAAP
jgi:transcription initiation factor TFIIB